MTMTDFGNAIADAVTDAVDRLRDETVDGELVRSVDEWAKVIRDDLDIANEGIISAGRHLIEAKRDVGHGNWLPLLEQIGIHERAAQRLMRIGSNEALTNPTNLSGLPSALSALVELAGVEPEDLQESIESGDVTPQTTAKDAKKLKEQKRDTAPIREWAKRNGIEVSDRGKLRADVVEAYERDCRTWLEAEHQHRAEQVACNLKFQAVNDNILNLAGQPGMSVFMLGWESAEVPNRDGFTVENIDLAIEFLTGLRNRVARGDYSSVETA